MTEKADIEMLKDLSVFVQERISKKELITVCLIALIGLTPLIVFMKVLDYPKSFSEIYAADFGPNLFTYYKSVWIYSFVLIALFFKNSSCDDPKLDFVFYRNCLTVFSIFLILSTIFSQDMRISVVGNPIKNEGALAWLGYVAIVFMSLKSLRKERDFKLIVFPVLAVATIIAIVGIFQFFGKDPILGGLEQRVLVSDSFFERFPDHRFGVKKADAGQMVLTFGNGNISGMYLAMIFCFVFGLALKLEGKFLFWLIPLNIILLLDIFLSGSKAGMVAICVVLLACLIFGFNLRKRFFKIIFLVLAGALIFVSLLGFFKQDFDVNNHFKFQFKRKISFLLPQEGAKLHDLVLKKNQAVLIFDGSGMRINYDENGLSFFNQFARKTPYKIQKKTETSLKDDWSLIVFDDEDDFIGYKVLIWPEKGLMEISYGDARVKLAKTEKGFFAIDPFGRKVKPVLAEAWGFKGFERVASARGYIWSRSLPLLKNTLLTGVGPDMFALAFPNNDYIGKSRFLPDGIFRMVDKPHNMYLQIAISTGVFSLIVLFFLFFAYLRNSIKLYRGIAKGNFIASIGFSCFLAVSAFLVTALFSDSSISVAPVFWGLLGIGIVANRLVEINKIETVENYQD